MARDIRLLLTEGIEGAIPGRHRGGRANSRPPRMAGGAGAELRRGHGSMANFVPEASGLGRSQRSRTCGQTGRGREQRRESQCSGARSSDRQQA